MLSWFHVGCVSAVVRGRSKELNCSSCVQSGIKLILCDAQSLGRQRNRQQEGKENVIG